MIESSDSFLDLQLSNIRYRSGDTSALPKDFYNAVLPRTKLYCRAVGFFSSSSFLEISYGILGLANNDGRMFLITSPKLNADDINAIKEGYDKRKVYMNAFRRELVFPDTIDEKNRLNVLANLIEKNILEIKIAVTENPEISMYHEKIGLFVDEENNKIAISGSINESGTAISKNFESFDIFCSWKNGDAQRVETREHDFYSLWKDKEPSLQVIEFPELSEELIHYKTSDLPIKPKPPIHQFDEEKQNNESFFVFSPGIAPRDYQNNAINQFVENDFQCLFAMATGTGKTLTSLFTANELSHHVKINSILIIVPLKDLVDQWESEIKDYFHGTIISIHSGINWKEDLEDLALRRRLGNNSEKVILITTYDSFCSNDERIVNALDIENTLIVADEVHGFGAKTRRTKLPEKIKYRIGLSATPKRAYDDEGTKAIFDYFCPSDKCFEFSIKNAISANMLCRYNYFPIIVKLTDDEMEKYEKLSEKISRLSAIISNETSTEEEKESYERLLKERHRIIERAKNKKELFIKEMSEQVKKYKGKTIVFCPDGKDESGKDLLEIYKTELWQAVSAKEILIMSEYIQGTKRNIIDNFSSGAIDIVFAKQRLNEGIDIPSACRAFFIASSTSEREFVQRRGRVLRNSPGKDIAEIFDFIVIPPDLSSPYADTIINTEIRRAMDFVVTAENYDQVESILREYL